jgi:hypothetical protein
MNFVFAKQIEFDTLFRFDTSQNRLEAGVLDGPKLFLDYASKNIAFPHLTVLYRRSRALEVGFYQLDALGADTASMLRLSLIGPVGFIDRPVGVWRIHPKSASSQRDQRTRVDNLEVIENAFRFAAKLEVHPRSVLERWRRAVLRIRLRGLLSSEREAGSLRSTLLLFGRLTAKYPRLSLSLFAQLPKFVRRRNQKLTSQSLADLRVMIERSNGVEGGNAERD